MCNAFNVLWKRSRDQLNLAPVYGSGNWDVAILVTNGATVQFNELIDTFYRIFKVPE